MFSAEVLPILFIIITGWLIILSLVFYLLLAHYKRLVKGVDRSNLKVLLDKILEETELSKKEIASIKHEIGGLRQESTLHIQKLGMVRFNPFNETGGDQSFSIALLNGHKNGFTITGLHARERTRVYVKSIIGGQSKHELSEEEKRAIKEALK